MIGAAEIQPAMKNAVVQIGLNSTPNEEIATRLRTRFADVSVLPAMVLDNFGSRAIVHGRTIRRVFEDKVGNDSKKQTVFLFEASWEA